MAATNNPPPAAPVEALRLLADEHKNRADDAGRRRELACQLLDSLDAAYAAAVSPHASEPAGQAMIASHLRDALPALSASPAEKPPGREAVLSGAANDEPTGRAMAALDAIFEAWAADVGLTTVVRVLTDAVAATGASKMPGGRDRALELVRRTMRNTFTEAFYSGRRSAIDHPPACPEHALSAPGSAPERDAAAPSGWSWTDRDGKPRYDAEYGERTLLTYSDRSATIDANTIDGQWQHDEEISLLGMDAWVWIDLPTPPDAAQERGEKEDGRGA